jgi:hypothetical protein
MTALHWAATKNDVDLAKVLLYAGANVKATTRIGGYTPLLIASKSGNTAMIETLVGAGADPNSTTVNGTTALMFAAQAGNADAVKALITRGADVNLKEKVKGETALTFAAAYGRADVIRVLTAHKADPNVATRGVDLAAFNKEEQERFAQFQQQAAQTARRCSKRAPTSISRPSATRAHRSSSPRSMGTSIWPGYCSTKAPTPTPPSTTARRHCTRRSTVSGRRKRCIRSRVPTSSRRPRISS